MLDIFYEEIVKEAANGKIKCFFTYCIIFNTTIPELNVEVVGNEQDKNILIPILFIKNKKLFDKLLIEYVEEALMFYDDSSFPKEIINDKNKKIKTIMILLWSDATYEDFLDPTNYLRKRIAYLKDNKLDHYRNGIIIGNSELLSSDILVQLENDKLQNETPKSFKLSLINPMTYERYELPRVYLGIFNNEAYLYAIQNDKNINMENNKYQKRITRLLYGIDRGLDVKEDTYEKYGLGNLKDVSPSFVLSTNIVFSILDSIGISKVHIPSILITRWNSKQLLLKHKKESLLKNNPQLEVDELIELEKNKINLIQSNLTEKFLRASRRLDYHHSGINIISYPFEVSSDMLMTIDNNYACNNPILDETYCLAKENYKKLK